MKPQIKSEIKPRQASTDNTTSKHKYIRLAELREMVPLSRATIWRRAKEGTFPRPVKLSPGIVAWNLQSVEHWLAQKEGN